MWKENTIYTSCHFSHTERAFQITSFAFTPRTKYECCQHYSTFFQANHEYHQESISSSSSSSRPSTDEDNFTSIHKQSQYKIISGLKLQGCKWLTAIMRGILLLWYSHWNQWFSTLAAHWNHLRSFLKFCCPALNPRNSNLIGQEYSPNVKWFKRSPGDFNVQPSVKAHQTKTPRKHL